MKFLFICSLVALALASVECSPKRGETKKCNTVCTAQYDPVCAQDHSVKGSRPRSFASECVMKAHNCENTAFMEVLYKGECKGAGGIRLS